MREKYPNFRRAQRERGPFYNGPAIRPSPRRGWFVWAMMAAIALGIIIGMIA